MNLVQSIDWAVFAPAAITAGTAVAVLLADLFLPEGRKHHLGQLTTAGLLAALLSLLPLRGGDRSTFCLAGPADLCSYTADTFAVVLQLLLLGGALIAALLSMPGLRAGPDTPGSLPRGEFWFLLLASASGAVLLPAARDFATLVLALEITTLPAYALIALRRGDRAGPEAAVKFFLTSVTSTAVMLLGVSFVYAASGSLFFAEIATALPQDGDWTRLAEAGVLLTLVGFVFKTGAVPFHFWIPETYAGAPLPVAGYLSVAGKTAGLAGLILVTVRAFPDHGYLWGPALAVLAGLTMTVGNVAALRTRPDDRGGAVALLAWSSIGQAGYLLVPVAAAGYATGPQDSSAAVGAAVAYALMYAVVNLGAFAVACAVAAHHPEHRLTDYRGLVARRPLLAFALGFFLLALAGLPPAVVGLFAKVAVFQAAVDAGLAVLAVVLAVNVVIALVYYLRWTALLFQGGGTQDPATGPDTAPVDAPTTGRDAPDRAAPSTTAAPAAPPAPAPPAAQPAPFPVPLPFATAIGVTALLAVVLSGAPQIFLRFIGATLF